MSFTPLTEQQARRLNQMAEQWIDELNVSVPVHAVHEWIHARQKLGILYRATHASNAPIFRPTPASFGGLDAAEVIANQMTEVFRAMTTAGIPNGHPIFEVFEPASDSVMNVAPAFHKRQAHAVQLCLHAPLFVPAELIPDMNHFSRWADGDNCEDRESWLRAGPRPIFPPTNF